MDMFVSRDAGTAHSEKFLHGGANNRRVRFQNLSASLISLVPR